MFQNQVIQEIVIFAFVWIHMSGIYIISAPRNNPSYTHRKIVIKIQRKKPYYSQDGKVCSINLLKAWSTDFSALSQFCKSIVSIVWISN